MFEAISKATGLIKNVIKLRDQAEILEAIIPLQEAITDAQREATEAVGKIYDLTQENHKLKDTLASHEGLKTWRSKYEFQKSEAGPQILALRKEYDPSLEYEYICANCYENGEKSGMQATGSIMTCNKCKAEIKIKHQKATFVMTDRSRGF